MKHCVILLFVAFYTCGFHIAPPTDAEIEWQINFEQAMAMAKKEGKSILMDFSGSDWCANCLRLEKEVFETEAFGKYAEKNFVMLRVDFPARKKNRLSDEQTRHNEQLAEKYNKQGVFPKVIVVNEQGGILASTGYKEGGAEKYIAHLKALLAK